MALTLVSSCVVHAQAVTSIPAAEASALAGIVEDDAADDPQFKKILSPAYTLYSAPLPIPEVATPK